MSMSMSISGGSSTCGPLNPKTWVDSSFQEEDLCLYFGKFRVNMDNSKQTETNTSSPGSSSNVSPNKPQQSEACSYTKSEIGVENSHSVPIPLYSQDIWRGQSVNTGGQFLGSNNLNGQLFTRNGNAYAGCQSHDVTLTERSGMYSNNNWYQSPVILNDMGNQSMFSNDSMLGSSHIARLAMTQSGSQYLLDSLLTSRDPLITNMIFEGVFDCLFEVMNDSHGHHLFGKLIQSCSDHQLRLIVAKMTLNVQLLINISVGKFGSKSIQRLIKVLEKSPLIDIVIAALSSAFEELMTNRTGSYVILKCLTVLDTEKNKKLYEAAVKLCITLAQNEKGCISLNEFITNSKAPYRETLMDEVSCKSKFLSQDPSGNFVVQHVLGLHNPLYSEHICLELRDVYIQLSLQKGGSHVVEKCLNSSGMVHVVTVLVKYEKLCQVARDQYGNYVIQTALKTTKRANSPLHRVLISKLLQNRNELVFGFGRKVLTLIDNGIPLD